MWQTLFCTIWTKHLLLWQEFSFCQAGVLRLTRTSGAGGSFHSICTWSGCMLLFVSGCFGGSRGCIWHLSSPEQSDRNSYRWSIVTSVAGPVNLFYCTACNRCFLLNFMIAILLSSAKQAPPFTTCGWPQHGKCHSLICFSADQRLRAHTVAHIVTDKVEVKLSRFLSSS